MAIQDTAKAVENKIFSKIEFFERCFSEAEKQGLNEKGEHIKIPMFFDFVCSHFTDFPDPVKQTVVSLESYISQYWKRLPETEIFVDNTYMDNFSIRVMMSNSDILSKLMKTKIGSQVSLRNNLPHAMKRMKVRKIGSVYADRLDEVHVMDVQADLFNLAKLAGTFDPFCVKFQVYGDDTLLLVVDRGLKYEDHIDSLPRKYRFTQEDADRVEWEKEERRIELSETRMAEIIEAVGLPLKQDSYHGADVLDRIVTATSESSSEAEKALAALYGEVGL